MRKRKYKIGDKFTPKNYNTFWKEYRISGIGYDGKETIDHFAYYVECYPHDDTPFSMVVQKLTEKLISKEFNRMENEITYRVQIDGEYTKGGNKISLVEESEDFGAQPYATLSVWCKDTPSLEEDEFVLKNYSENDGIDNLLMENGIIELTGEYVEVGYNECPVARLTDKREWNERG